MKFPETYFLEQSPAVIKTLVFLFIPKAYHLKNKLLQDYKEQVSLISIFVNR